MIINYLQRILKIYAFFFRGGVTFSSPAVYIIK